MCFSTNSVSGLFCCCCCCCCCCCLQLHNCRGLNAEIPAHPDPAPMTQWRDTPLTHETAEDLFIGWLSNGPQIPDGGPGLKPYSWLVAAGKNPVSEGCWGGVPICHPAAYTACFILCTAVDYRDLPFQFCVCPALSLFPPYSRGCIWLPAPAGLPKQGQGQLWPGFLLFHFSACFQAYDAFGCQHQLYYRAYQKKSKGQLCCCQCSKDSLLSLVCSCFPALSQAYDAFGCQHQLYYRGKGKGQLWYEPVFRVTTLEGQEVWRKRR